MISASSSFIAGAVALNQKPVLLAVISKYNRAFSTGTVLGTLYTDLDFGGLCGCFTDGTGQIIGQPFPVGNGPATLKVPVGATQLQLGINDNVFADNLGSWVIDVNGSPVTVLATSMPWTWVAGGLNTAFQIGLLQDGTAPTVVSGLSAGQVVTIQYKSGMAQFTHFSGSTSFDADGDQTSSGGATAGNGSLFGLFPTVWMTIPIYPWLVNVQDIKTTVNDLDGGCDLADLVFNVQDFGQAITADFASFVFEGKKCYLLEGSVGMTVNQYLTRFTGVIDVVASANGNDEYQFTAPSENSKKLSALIYTTGDDGFATDSSHPRTVIGHPIDIMVSALQQAGISLALIDTPKLYFYRDTIYSGDKFVLSLTSAPAAGDFIKNELMKPLGAYMRETNLAVMTATFFYPALSGSGGYTPPTLPVATADDSTACQVPIAGEAALVNNVDFRFDDDGDGNGKFLGESIQQYGPSIAKYGLVGQQIIESKGMRSAFQAFLWAQIISRLIFLRYGNKNLVLDSVPFFWSESLIEPGDIIALTLPQVPNRAGGTFGIAAMTFEVLDTNLRLMAGIIELKLLAIDLTKFKQFLITPNAEADFAADTAPNQAKYMYLSDAAGKYSTGVDANTLG